MNQANEIQNFKLALDKYKLTNPIPEEIQQFSIASKKRVFVRIMKTLGKYTLLSGLTLSLYFFIKKIGLSTLASKLLVFVTISASVTTATYYSVKYIKKHTETVKPVEIVIAPSAIKHKSRKNWTTFSIKGTLSDKTTKDISNDVTFIVSPADLAVVTQKNNKLKLAFKKQGKGTLTAKWNDIQKNVAIEYTRPRAINSYSGLRQAHGHLEKVYLKDGNIFMGVLKDKGTMVELITPSGILTFERSNIDRIEYNVRPATGNRNKILINQFKTNTLEKTVLDQITAAARQVTARTTTKSRFKIDGQIDKIGDSIYISMKLINLETHRLVTMKSKSVTNIAEAKSICKTYASSFISDHLAQK